MRTAVRAGFVGTGFMADVHTRAARGSGARLAGIVGSTPERGAAAANRLGVDQAFPTLEAMLGSGAVDVVHVLTPNALHAGAATAVIAAGLHVVCEKPLATDVAEAEALVAAAAYGGVVATVPFVYRFHPMVREARARVSGRTLSTIRGAYVQDWLLGESDDDWRVSAAVGGRSRAFGDIGSHLVDLLEFVTGDRVVGVAAATKTLLSERGGHPVDTEDAVAVTARFAGGAIGVLLVSQVTAGRKNALTFEIATSSETVAFDQEHPETLWIGRRAGTELLPRDPAQLSPDAARLSIVPAGHPLGYVDAFTAFVRDTYATIAGDDLPGLPRFADGLRAARVTDAVMTAAERGTWIDLPNEGVAR